MGIIPKGTKLTPRPEEIPAWDSAVGGREEGLRAADGELRRRTWSTPTHEVGRLVDSLAASGELDNTLFIYIVGDNGASAEGGLEGTFNESPA